MSVARTLKAVGIEQIFAFFMRLDTALSTADALSGKAPQQPFAFKAVSGRGRAPNDEVVRRRRRNWINERLQSFFVYMLLLSHTHTHTHSINRHYWCILVFSQLYLAQSCKKTVRYLTLSRTTNQFHIFNFFFTVCFIWKVLSFLIVS